MMKGSKIIQSSIPSAVSMGRSGWTRGRMSDDIPGITTFDVEMRDLVLTVAVRKAALMLSEVLNAPDCIGARRV